MAPDAIIRLIQSAYQIGARIGERETLPAAYMMQADERYNPRELSVSVDNRCRKSSLAGALNNTPSRLRSRPAGVFSAQAA